jgi:hypothetical protein
MKPLAFNLKDAKKIAGDKNSSTFHLKNGHKIMVAHAALPAEQRKALQALPVVKLMADGGDTTPNPAPNQDSSEDSADQIAADAAALAQANPSAPSPSPNDSAAPLNNSDIPSNDVSSQPTGPTPNPQPNQSSDEVPGSIAAAPVGADQTTPPAAPDQNIPNAGAPVGPQANQGATPPSNPLDVQGLYQKGQKAIQEQADVDKQLAAANAKNEESDINARQDVLAGFKQNTQDFQDNQKQFMQDYMNNHIDPKHYQESMTSGQKVATGIGLFLGGWSSAYTHQGNPALDFLNKQIDRDIGAQQSRIDQQKTLLGANQELYHDQVLAQNATRMQMNDIYSHQTQLAAAKLGTPQAQAKADAASAQWGLQNAGLLQQNALRATVLHSMASGGQGVQPIDLGNAGLMDPKTAENEQRELDSQKAAISSTKNIFQQLNQEQTAMNWLNPESSRRVGALNAQLVNTVMEASPSKRLTRESIEAEIKPFEINTTDDASVRQSKLDGVLNLIGKTGAGTTPVTARYAPKSLPQYPFQQAAQAPQYKVGDVVYVKGQPVQIINQAGDYRPVKK